MGAKTGQMSHALLTTTAGFATSAPTTSGHLDALGQAITDNKGPTLCDQKSTLLTLCLLLVKTLIDTIELHAYSY